MYAQGGEERFAGWGGGRVKSSFHAGQWTRPPVTLVLVCSFSSCFSLNHLVPIKELVKTPSWKTFEMNWHVNCDPGSVVHHRYLTSPVLSLLNWRSRQSTESKSGWF